MIAMTTDSLTAEKRRELSALGYHFFRNAHLILGLRLSYHKLSDLDQMKAQVSKEDKIISKKGISKRSIRSLPESQCL